jgi:hypothetical protein
MLATSVQLTTTKTVSRFEGQCELEKKISMITSKEAFKSCTVVCKTAGRIVHCLKFAALFSKIVLAKSTTPLPFEDQRAKARCPKIRRSKFTAENNH